MALHPLKMAALVALGGSLGALGRYYTSLGVAHFTGQAWPWGTLAVNLLGCLLLGYLTSASTHRSWVDPQVGALVMTGGLGAFTTFSTFSVDGLKLFKQQDSLWPGVGYVLLSVLGGLAMAGLGFWFDTWSSQR